MSSRSIQKEIARFFRQNSMFEDAILDFGDNEWIRVVTKPAFEDIPSVHVKAHKINNLFIIKIKRQPGAKFGTLVKEIITFLETYNVLPSTLKVLILPDETVAFTVTVDPPAADPMKDKLVKKYKEHAKELNDEELLLSFEFHKVADVRQRKKKSVEHDALKTASSVLKRPSSVKTRSSSISELQIDKPPEPPKEKEPLRTDDGFMQFTEEEKLVIRALMRRANLKAQSNHLKKDTDLDQDTIRKILKKLVKKDVLSVSSGWYYLKRKKRKPRKTSTAKKTTTTRKRKKRRKVRPIKRPKSAQEKATEIKDAIQRVIISLPPEEQAIVKLLVKQEDQKMSAKAVREELDLPRNKIREALRQLVQKQLLTISQGQYVLKKPPSQEKDKLDLFSEGDVAMELTLDEHIILDTILGKRKRKAQSNHIAKKLNMPIKEVKKILQQLKKKGYIKVKSGWYIATKKAFI